MSDQARRPISRLAAVRRRPRQQASSNLPAPLTSFVGRDREVEALTDRLAESRLLTLTGIGGIGKSRLALEVARTAQGTGVAAVSLVELSAVADPGGVSGAVASALGVQESGERPVLDALVTGLAGRDLLLVLDNCEPLVEAVATLALDLLRRCPDLRVLATSRIPLGLSGESVWRVEPLAVPDLKQLPTRSSLTRYSAVRLFVDRARAARPDFQLTNDNAADVVRICTRLDGIPLAIELAATRIGMLSPRQLCDRLDDRFHLLTLGRNGTQDRQRTLRAALD